MTHNTYHSVWILRLLTPVTWGGVVLKSVQSLYFPKEDSGVFQGAVCFLRLFKFRTSVPINVHT